MKCDIIHHREVFHTKSDIVVSVNVVQAWLMMTFLMVYILVYYLALLEIEL